MEKEKKPIRTSIGGQALIEGVMMRSPEKTAVTVRLPNKSLETKMFDAEPLKNKYKILGWPLIRGVAGFIDSMKLGYSTLMYSAEKAATGEDEEDPSKFDLWLQKTFGDSITKIVGVVGMVLGLLLAIVLFFWLPTTLFNLVQPALHLGDVWRAVAEGVFRMGIFIAYIILCARMKEMRRVFMYHGAEHKTIACFESGDELTVENVRKHTRFHPRCGTSFMILMLLIGVLFGMLIPQTGAVVRTIVKLLCLPLIMGFGYELLKLCGKYDNIATRIIAKPGIWMQHLTTKEPDDDQIEVAVCAFVAAAPKNELTEEMQMIALYLKTKNDVIELVADTEEASESEQPEQPETLPEETPEEEASSEENAEPEANPATETPESEEKDV